MVQIAEGSDRQVWASGIGRIIFSLNEIDWLLERVCTTVLSKELPHKWLSKTFSERLDIIEAANKAVSDAPSKSALTDLIERTRRLNETRNHVAHGTLGLVGAPDGAPRGASFVMIRYHKKSDAFSTVDFHTLIIQMEEAMALSNDYAAFLTRCRFHADFIAPHLCSDKA